jgi:hypothetical protein
VLWQYSIDPGFLKKKVDDDSVTTITTTTNAKTIMKTNEYAKNSNNNNNNNIPIDDIPSSLSFPSSLSSPVVSINSPIVPNLSAPNNQQKPNFISNLNHDSSSDHGNDHGTDRSTQSYTMSGTTSEHRMVSKFLPKPIISVSRADKEWYQAAIKRIEDSRNKSTTI